MLQPSLASAGGGLVVLGLHWPSGLMLQLSLLQAARRKLQRWSKNSKGDSETASAGRPAAEAGGAARTAAKRSRRTAAVRRNGAVRMAAPWRALRRGRHDRAGGPP